VGAMYYRIETAVPSADGSKAEGELQYINVGATYWIWKRYVSAGIRYARSTIDTSEMNVTTLDTNTFIGSLCLTL